MGELKAISTSYSVDLGVQDRLQLLSILPQEGNIVTLRIVNDLRRDLSFTDEEIRRLNLRTEGQQVHWDDKVEAQRSVIIPPTAQRLIVDTLEKLNASNKLSVGQLPLYERFVEGK